MKFFFIKEGDIVYTLKSVQLNDTIVKSFYVPLVVEKVAKTQFTVTIDGQKLRFFKGGIGYGHYRAVYAKGDVVNGRVVKDETHLLKELQRKLSILTQIRNSCDVLFCDGTLAELRLLDLEIVFDKFLGITDFLKTRLEGINNGKRKTK